MTPLRYAVLHHTGVADPHFDLLVEPAAGSPLATWRSPAWPMTADTPLVRADDHRAVYLNYEGPVGGGRGTVARVAGGACDVSVEPDGAWVVTPADGEGFRVAPTAAGGWVGRPVPGK